jgi:hypothetical protein
MELCDRLSFRTLLALLCFVALFSSCASQTKQVFSREPAASQKTYRVPAVSELAPLLVPFDPLHIAFQGPLKQAASSIGRWTDCFETSHGRSPTRVKVNGQLLENCQPDTLYSWQSALGFSTFKTDMASAENLSRFSRGSIFTHINPVATFGYGDYPVRIKLRATVKFKRILDLPTKDAVVGQFCNFLKPEEVKDTVLVRVFNSGTDYILCSPAVVDSWSIFSKRHYDEIVAATLWYFEWSDELNWLPYREPIPTKKDDDVSALFISDEMKTEGFPPFLFDGHDFSQVKLAENLRLLRQNIEIGATEVHLSRGEFSDTRSHFQTKKRAYWSAKE